MTPMPQHTQVKFVLFLEKLSLTLRLLGVIFLIHLGLLEKNESLKFLYRGELLSGPSWAAQLISKVLICQGCGFDSQSGHIKESTNECINKWNNKKLSLSQINK